MATTLNWAKIRYIFGGSLEQSQVDGITTILAEADKQEITIKEQIAYILATVFHETGRTMMPVTELGSNSYLAKYDTGVLAKQLGNTPGADGDGQRYKGRGYCQVTGLANYTKFNTLLAENGYTDYDLVNHPEQACIPKVAAFILVYGMKHGSFTGVSLSKYITPTHVDLVGARRIINGTDKASIISGYATNFTATIL
jgi:putative chitinase